MDALVALIADLKRALVTGLTACSRFEERAPYVMVRVLERSDALVGYVAVGAGDPGVGMDFLVPRQALGDCRSITIGGQLLIG